MRFLRWINDSLGFPIRTAVCRTLCAVACCLLLVTPVMAADSKDQDKADNLSLAALMIKDGSPERAEAALAKIDVNHKGLDLTRYYTLLGLVSLQLQDYTRAMEALRKAIAAGQEAPIVHVYLAQAYFHLEQYAEVIDALDAAGEAGRNNPQLLLILAESLWRVDRFQDAWASLGEGEVLFPDEKTFLRRKVFLLVEAELYRSAVELGKQYLLQDDPSLDDYLAIARALRNSRQHDEAIFFFEAALLKFPGHRDALLECAHAYLDLDMKHVAAHLFERAARLDPELADEAAEVQRRAKQYTRALYWNSRVVDQKEKIKQRLAILIDQKEFGQVVAMKDSVVRVNLIDDDNIAYAMAYSHFKIGAFDEAERFLQSLRSNDAFNKGIKLRKAMTDCQDAKWQCY